MKGRDMSTSIRRSRADRAPLSQQMGIAVALLACAGLAACTAADTPMPTPTAEVHTIAPLPSSGDLAPGTYLVTGFTVPFEITVPEGWTSLGWGAFKEEAGEWKVAVSFLTVGQAPDRPAYVPTDGCAWRGAIVEVEPSPAAFAAAMRAQLSTATTVPVKVTVGNYSGFEFDYSVERDVDIAGCDHALICVWSERPDACAHGFPMNGRETERVLDINGELAVIAVAEFVSVDPALRREAYAVFDSIAFAPDK